MCTIPENHRLTQSGVAMLEVLITIVILAFGLLGFAGLNAAGIASNHGSYLRSQAALQAYDMSDRIRANLTGASTTMSYDSISGAGTDPGCIATGCTWTQMAAYDQWAWNSANAAILPSGQGTVVRSGNFLVVTVMWDGDRKGATGTGCDNTNTADLKCFILRVQP
jgi:type IV pilus assembly protein PilV